MSKISRTIVVLEPRPRWEPELQRQFLNESDVRVRGRRTWKELSTLLDRGPWHSVDSSREPVSAIVIVLPDDASECLQWLNQTFARALAPPIIVIADAIAGELEWPLREIGVREVLIGDLTGERLAKCCRRCWS